MYTLFFCIYAVITLVGIVFFSLREFHMLQLNGYKTPEHSWWIKKNFRRYIFPLVLFAGQFALLATGYNIPLLILFTVCNAVIAILNKPSKKFKKPLKYTARVKRMMVTFFILVAVMFAVGTISGSTPCKCYEWKPFNNILPFIMVNSALYLTPLLVPLSNLINKPLETYIQHWYINDAKRILSEMPDLHKIGITGSYGKTSMKFYLSELLSSQYNTLKTPESFNTPMGVTITVRQHLKPTHEYFICEMGARRVHEIKELCEIAHPHDAIITSVGPQHLETFGSIENVVNTKFELADSVQAVGGKIYLNGDNELIRKKAPQYKNAVMYGLQEHNDYRATDISVSEGNQRYGI